MGASDVFGHFGFIYATVLTLVVIPVLYFRFSKKRDQQMNDRSVFTKKINFLNRNFVFK